MNHRNTKMEFSLKFSSKNIRNLLYINGIILFLIILVGIIIPVLQVDDPANKNTSPFPEERYYSADQKNIEDYFKINKNYILSKIREEIRSENPGYYGFEQRIERELSGREVIVPKFSFNDISEITNLLSKKEQDTRAGIKAIENEINNMNRFSTEKLEKKVSLEKQLESILTFKSAFKGSSAVVCYYSFSNNKVDYDCGVGVLSEIKREGSKLLFILRDGYPITSGKYLTDKGYSRQEISNIDFIKQKKVLDDIYQNDKTLYNQSIKQKQKESKSGLQQQRKTIRKDFYRNWFSIYINVLTNLAVILILFQYIRILRRKGLDKKSTFEVYFATNISSSLFRWISIIIVLGGFFAVLISFIAFIISTFNIGSELDLLSSYPLANKVGLAFALFIPIIILLTTVISSWIFILISEWLCFISNVYHVLFEKAHKNNN